MKLTQFTLALCLLFSFALFGQNSPTHLGCATDEAMSQFYLTYPEKLAEQELFEKNFYLKINSGQDAFPPPYTLPVVVHVIHQNGAENIPDAQIELAIEQMNEAFSHSGYYGGQGPGYDTQIQFCLAKQDPDGNASNGITRHNSPLTNMVMETEDVTMKDLARWDPLEYINIYVVNEITSNSSGPGVAGYAFFPSSHGMPEDGLVCEAQFMGSSPAQNAVLIHEMGHYLNLYHTFQGGCGNDDCLMDGDRVCDTPPDQSTFTGCNFNSCDTDLDDTSANNPLTANEDDPTENYMDYSPFECYHAFTPGQANRMYAAIELVRFSLLDSKGCFDPCTLPITIDFTASGTDIFAGQTVNFTNNSTGATIFEWSVDGVPFSVLENTSYTFNDVGVFEVELFVTNADVNCFERLTLEINVKCPVIPEFNVSSLELEVGEPFLATNISQNATDYEWYINGVLITTGTDLSFTFSNDGLYTVLLVATDGSCTNNFFQLIEVSSNSLCVDSIIGNYFEFVPSPSGTVGFFQWDLMPDGGLITNPYTPPTGVAARFDPAGNLLWQEEILIPNNGIEDMCVFDDSSVGFTIDAGDRVFKLDDTGAMQWVKSLTLPAGSVELRAFSTGDGMIVYTSQGGPPTRLFMAKFLTDGSVAWTRIYDSPLDINFVDHWGGAGASGQGFYLVSGVDESFTNPLGGGVAYFNDNGELQFFKRYNEGYAADINFWDADLTSDGGFITAARIRDLNTFSYDTVMVMKGNSNGDVLWTKKYELPGGLRPRIFTRPAGGYLLRNRPDANNASWLAFDENGNLEFEEELQFDGYIFEILKRNGVMKGAIKSFDNNAPFFHLTELDAEGRPIDCFTSTPVQTVQLEDTDMLVEDVPFVLSTETITIVDDNLGTQEYESELTSLPYCENPAPCPEICDNGIDDDGDGYIDCFDVDCECSNGEDCEAEEPPTNNFTSQLAWQSDLGPSSLATPMVANLDPQNGPMPEIIVAQGDQNISMSTTENLMIFSGDGSNTGSPVELTVPQGIAVNPVSPPTIGDMNGDGIPEVALVCGDQRIRVFTNYDPTANPAMELWATSVEQCWNVRAIPALADFDGDGTPEILVGNDVFRFDLSNPSAPTLTRALDGNGHLGRLGFGLTNIPGISSVSTAADVLSVTDCGGDPDCDGLEILAGANIYSVDLDLFDGDGFEIKIQRDLNVMAPGNNYVDGYTVTADVNHDGFLDVIVTSRRDSEMGMYVYDKNGLLGWFPYPNNSDTFVSIAAVANVYDDTVDGHSQDLPEIICVSAFRMTAFNMNTLSTNPAQPYHWTLTTNDNSGYTGATIFDFNGDGIDEICYRDPQQFRIIYGGPAPFPPGVSFNRNWTTAGCLSATYGEAPVVADCDADGEAEIIFTGNIPPNTNFSTTVSNLWVMESGNQPWVACRPVWNQYAYFGVNVNDDLSIPTNQQSHQLEFPGLGSGNRPFNQFLAQMPILDEDFNPFYPVPDATVLVDSSQCEGDSIRVWFTVCNEGSNGLPAEMPIVFYDNDPTAVFSIPLSFPVELGTALLPGECANLEAVVLAQYNAPIHVAANVDWFFPTPFDPLTDFPTTDIVECDYENNFAEFTELSGATNPPDLGPDIVLCNSSVVSLDAGGPYDSYEWQDGSEEQIFTAFLPGTYWVTVQTGCGQPQSDTIVISLDQSATIDLGPDVTLCGGDSIELNVTDFNEVSWWPTDVLNCEDCPTVVVSPEDTITIYATGSNGNCIVTDSIQINVEEVEVELTTDTLTCTDTVGSISTSSMVPNLVYVWSGPGGFSANGPSIDVFLPGDYTVTVTNTLGGCGAIETITVEADTLPPVAEIDANGNVIPCDALSVTLDATASSQGVTFNYSWTPSSGIVSGASTLSPQVDSVGTYILVVTEVENGCTASGEVEVTAEEKPEIVDLNILPAACDGMPTGQIEILEVQGGTPPYSYSFNGEPFTTSNIFEDLPAGNYTLRVADIDACLSEIEVEIGQNGPLSVTLSGDTLVNPDEPFQLLAEVMPPDAVLSEIVWTPGGLPPQLGVNVMILNETLFTISVTDTSGCTATDELLVQLVRPGNNVYFPNVIHPNSPNGDNLAFTGFGGEAVSLIRTLKVFDRWGGLVFEGENLMPNDTSSGWDGTADGDPVNQGLYVFLAEVEFSDGEVIQVSGEVMVVR